MNKNVIDLSVLLEQYEKFSNLKDHFQNEKYAHLKSGYLFQCSDSTVQKMAQNLNKRALKMETGYKQILEWWKSYSENAKGVEQLLSQAPTNSITEDALAGFTKQKFPALPHTEILLSSLLAPSLIAPSVSKNSQAFSETQPKDLGEASSAMEDPSQLEAFLEPFTFEEKDFLMDFFQSIDFDFSLSIPEMTQRLEEFFHFTSATIGIDAASLLSKIHFEKIPLFASSEQKIGDYVVSSSAMSVSGVFSAIQQLSFEPHSSSFVSSSFSPSASISSLSSISSSPSFSSSFASQGYQNIDTKVKNEPLKVGSLNNNLSSSIHSVNVDVLPTSYGAISLSSVSNLSLSEVTNSTISSSISSKIPVQNNNVNYMAMAASLLLLGVGSGLFIKHLVKEKKEEQS